MYDGPLTEREVDDVLAGRQPAGRADLAAVAEWIAYLRGESRAQPAPPIDPYLRAQIDRHAVPALLRLESQDEVSEGLGADALTAITTRSSDFPRQAVDRDPRPRRTAVSVAAAVLMLLGTVAGVRLAAGQPDEPDVRSRPATESSISDSGPADDPEDPGDLDRFEERDRKEPPPPAEPEPPEPVVDSDDSQPEPRAHDPLVSGEWGDLADEWLERFCESEIPRHQGGGRRGDFDPHSSRDFRTILCDPDSFSGGSPRPGHRSQGKR